MKNKKINWVFEDEEKEENNQVFFYQAIIDNDNIKYGNIYIGTNYEYNISHESGVNMNYTQTKD